MSLAMLAMAIRARSSSSLRQASSSLTWPVPDRSSAWCKADNRCLMAASPRAGAGEGSGAADISRLLALQRPLVSGQLKYLTFRSQSITYGEACHEEDALSAGRRPGDHLFRRVRRRRARLVRPARAD